MRTLHAAVLIGTMIVATASSALAQFAAGGTPGVPSAAGGTSAAIAGGTMGPSPGGFYPGGASGGIAGGTMGPSSGMTIPGGGTGAIGLGTMGPGGAGTSADSPLGSQFGSINNGASPTFTATVPAGNTQTSFGAIGAFNGNAFGNNGAMLNRPPLTPAATTFTVGGQQYGLTNSGGAPRAVGTASSAAANANANALGSALQPLFNPIPINSGATPTVQTGGGFALPANSLDPLGTLTNPAR